LNAADGRRDEDGICSLRLPFHMRRRRGEVVLSQPSGPVVSPRIDRALVRAVVLAKTWSRELEQGGVASIKALARREGLCNHYTSRLLPLAYLAPDITEAILAGRQPRSLSLAP
jgi:site-specific DNA recombinase